MKKFTKAQRHKYYKLALEDLIKRDDYYYICRILESITKINYKKVLDYFPEFMNKKPKKLFFDGSIHNIGDVWWNTNSKRTRITALKKCIEETKPTKNAKRTPK